MTRWFISRHEGAIDWAKKQRLKIDRWEDHLSIDEVKTEDVVIGSLPVSLAALICDRGAQYWHLSLELPVELRGKELSQTEMAELNASIKRYVVSSG